MIRYLFFLLAFSWVQHTYAQLSLKGAGQGIEVNFCGGKIFKHTKNFKAPLPSLATAVELNYIFQTTGRKEWQQRRNFPLVGLGFAYTNYGIDSVYGKCFSAYPFIQLPILKGKKFEWTFRAGFGIGYVSKCYQRAPVWDTLNNAIGSHLNNYTILSTDLRYHINNHWDVQIGGNFSHISNGGFRSPNLGINLYGAHVGFRYFPTTSNPPRAARLLAPLNNRLLFHIRLGFSATEDKEPDGALYPVYIASAYVSKRYHNLNKIFAGIDYSYHEAIYAFLRNNEVAPGHEKDLSWKSALFVGNEFLFGRIGILLQFGWYLRRSALPNSPYYEKLGANVYLLQQEKGLMKEATLGIFLKAHNAQAEFAEIGLGFAF
ncbi:MAG: acyloxyacyl hydrolase [Bacteroidetes bacterium]|nr:acyloxyacyl hydrolase [Bacteroidota bacterium]MBS1740055.1 acyloxyacyl hydrolase [Bacteroidota bacterium]